MFIPVHDDNPLRSIRWPFVTYGLIIANIIVFLFESAGLDQRVVASFGIVPAELFQVKIFGGAARGPNDAIAVPEGLTLLSYMFFHGDFWHITGNMLFLWVFGDNVEDAMGHVRYLAFYIFCGVFAALFHAFMLRTSPAPLIGASGAVAGIIAAYVLLYPRVLVWVLAFRVIPLRIPALWAIGAWIATQIVMALLPAQGPVAWFAHIGGLIAGAILVVFLRRPGVPLFRREPAPTPISDTAPDAPPAV
jgi:membrane associated rhomboid family serine protease